MSVYDYLKNTAISLYNSVAGNDGENVRARNSKPAQKSQKPPKESKVKPVITIPIVNPNAGAPKKNPIYEEKGVGDVLVSTGEDKKLPKNNEQKTIQQTIQQTKNSIMSKLAKAGVKDTKTFNAELRIKLSGLTDKKTKEEFKELDPKLRLLMMSYVEEAVDRCTKANLKNVSLADAIATDIAVMYNFITHDENGNTVELKTLTPEQVKARREAAEVKYGKIRKERMAEIKKLPEAERAEALKQIDSELSAHRKHLFQKLYKNISYKNAMELLLIVNAEDVGDAAEELMEYYPSEIRKEIASTMQTFDSFLGYIESVNKRGIKIDKEKAYEAFQKYHRVFTSYKTAEELNKYEANYVQARDNKNLPEEFVKATAQGIGEGVYVNHVMTTEQKGEFLQTWVSDNNVVLSDTEMAQVEENGQRYVREYLEKHPEEAENFQHVTHSMKDTVEKTLGREFKPEKTEDKKQKAENKSDKSESVKNPEQETNIPSTSDTVARFTSSAKKGSTNPLLSNFAQKSNKEQTGYISSKKTPEQVVNGILAGEITKEEALKSFNEENKLGFMIEVVKNQTLLAMFYKELDTYIKSKPRKVDLLELANHAPGHIKLDILANMRGDKQEFAQELIKAKMVDTNIKTILENTYEEDAKGYTV